MKLLIKRDKTLLSSTEGQVLVDGVPDFLRIPRVVDPTKIRVMEERGDDDLLITNRNDYESMDSHLKLVNGNNSYFQYLKNLIRKKKLQNIPALWSGYRSVLVQDPKTNNLFRLKGVSLNPKNPQITEFEDGSFWIDGGQKKQNLEYERQMSNKFNKLLLANGIKPVMQYVGMWSYPNLIKKHRPAASIYQVEGDTRLDELMFILDNLSNEKTVGEFEIDGNLIKKGIGGLTDEGCKFSKAINKLYYDIGFVVGRLKNLMDKSGQTWSCESERTNAHIGNIVVYNGTNKMKVGFVDFDASCDLKDYTRSEIRDIQSREYKTIQTSIFGLISMREIKGRSCYSGGTIASLCRKEFLKGFESGYAHRGKRVSNEVDIGLIEEIFSLLRGTANFSFPSKHHDSLFKITKEDYLGIRNNYRGSYTSSLEDIIKGNKMYQDSIIEDSIIGNKSNKLDSLINEIGSYGDSYNSYKIKYI